MSEPEPSELEGVVRIGRYTLLREIAAGGMGTVHLAKFHGQAGFSRLLAVKRLHPQFAKDPDFLCMFLDEARIASRVRHPHVVSVIDVVSHEGELLLVMDYVRGLPLSKILRLLSPVALEIPIAVAIAGGMLKGLHAAHEAKDDKGVSLGLVHRDVSPQNLMVGDDGVVRVVDFGVAAATSRLQTTVEGQVKGKLSYMPPEQVNGDALDRRADLFAAGVVLWEMLTGRRFSDGTVAQRVGFVLAGKFQKPSEFRPDLPPALDAVVMRALSPDPKDRYSTAEEMMGDLYRVESPAHDHEVGAWTKEVAGVVLSQVAEVAETAESLTALLPVEGLEAQGDGERLKRPLVSQRSLAFLLSGAVVLLLIGFTLWNMRQEGSQQAHAERSAPPAPTATEVVSAPQPSPPIPSAQPVSPPPKPVVRPTARSVVPVAPQPKPRAVRDKCSPPYVLLKGGLKRYKPECL